jgi:acetyl esterase
VDPALEATLARFASLKDLPSMPLNVARRVNDDEASEMFGPVESLFLVEEMEIANGPRIRIYRPVSGELLPLLLYFHGGGWVVGSLDSHDGVARHLAKHSGALVISVDYRLAPEHPFPAAVDDARAALAWAHAYAPYIGGDANRMAVAGDSAGGNLAAVLARHARDLGTALALQLLVYPALDSRLDRADPESAWWLRQYLRTEADGFDPDASPVLAPGLHGVAPAFILSCELDPLVHQADDYAARLIEAGGEALHFSWPGLIHGAFRMPAVLPLARDMLDAGAAAVRVAFEPDA